MSPQNAQPTANSLTARFHHKNPRYPPYILCGSKGHANSHNWTGKCSTPSQLRPFARYLAAKIDIFCSYAHHEKTRPSESRPWLIFAGKVGRHQITIGSNLYKLHSNNAEELVATMYLPLKSILPEGHDVGNGWTWKKYKKQIYPKNWATQTKMMRRYFEMEVLKCLASNMFV